MSHRFPLGIRVGGSALPDGVMMLTPLAVAFAREGPDGTFVVEAQPLPVRKPRRIEKFPFVRILPKLFAQLAFVVRGWKPQRSSSPPWALLTAVAAIGFISMASNRGLSHLSPLWHASTSSLVQLVLFFGCIGLTRMLPRFGRIWRFHGGEHQAIAAYEAGLDLTVENATSRTLYHPRCGTNLATLSLILMVPGMVFASLVAGFWGYLITLALPLPSLCVAFEIVMFGQKRMRAVLWPGLALQRLTVASPRPQESLAGILALQAALAEHEKIEAARQQPDEIGVSRLGARSAQ